VRIAYDVTPLSHSRTGVGNYILGTLEGMVEAAAGEHELVAFGPVSIRGRKLLDETLSGVDAGGRRAMCERVRELAASGVAVLLASSDLAAVEQIAARVLVMRNGGVIREAPTVALLRERVLEILLDAPHTAPPPGFRLTPYGLQTDLGPRSAEAALALCREHRLAVRASRVRFRTLEDTLLDAQG